MSAWRYGSAPQREMRMYPRDAWLGWRPLGSPLPYGFDDDGEPEAIVARIRRGGSVAAYELTLSHSLDSRPPISSDHGGYAARSDDERARLRKPRKPEMLQQRWEREQREAQQAKQAAADRLWMAEEQQRKAAETRARRKAAEAEAIAFRAQHEAKDDRDHEQVSLARREWSDLNPAYAAEEYRKVLIPGLQAVFIYGWWLNGGREYWLPQSVIERLEGR